MTFANPENPDKINQETYSNDAKARRVRPVDETGTDYDSSNPIPTSIEGSVGGVQVSKPLDFTAFDLNAAAFSETTNISVDFTFDSVLLKFSTAESKIVTITSVKGIKFYESTTTSQSLLIPFGRLIDADDNVTVEVTQFSSPGTMDCTLITGNATSTLVGEPSLRAVSDNPEVFEDDDFVTGDSPVSLDVNAALSRNGKHFMVWNDGPGDFTVATSTDGAVFGGEHTMKSGETYNIENISIDTIRIIWVADSAYRVVVI